MDLTKTAGHAHTNIFVDGQASVARNDTTLPSIFDWSTVSAASGIGWALGKPHPVAATLGTISVLTGVLAGLEVEESRASQAGVVREIRVVDPKDGDPAGFVRYTQTVASLKTWEGAPPPDDVGLSGGNDVIIGSQIIRFVRLHADAVATSDDDDFFVDATAKYIPNDAATFETFEIEAWANIE